MGVVVQNGGGGGPTSTPCKLAEKKGKISEGILKFPYKSEMLTYL